MQELGYDPTLSGLSSLNGDMVANSCRRTLTTLIQNAMENVENKILEVLETIGEQMAPVIKDFLLKSTNLVTYAARDKTAVLNYLDENLVLLKKNLTEDNFERVLAVLELQLRAQQVPIVGWEHRLRASALVDDPSHVLRGFGGVEFGGHGMLMGSRSGCN